jgi:ribosomal protein S18 acetylase RimI-like enzyme
MKREIEMFQCESVQKIMEDKIIEDLSKLLISVVDDGASIGFLSPLGFVESEEYWRHVLQPGIILWGVKCDGKVVGSVQLHLSLKSNGLHRAEVCKLMVDPEYRRLGIGKQLMEAVEVKAKGMGRSLLVLDTRDGDPSNILYKQIGYIEAGKIPRYAKSSNGMLDGTVIYYKELVF